MARISYAATEDIDDWKVRKWLEASIERGRPRFWLHTLHTKQGELAADIEALRAGY